MDFLKEIRDKIGDALKSIHPEENQALFDCKQAIMKAIEEHVASETAELEKDYAELKSIHDKFFESDAAQHKEISALKSEIDRLEKHTGKVTTEFGTYIQTSGKEIAILKVDNERLREGIQKALGSKWAPDIPFKLMELQSLLSPADGDGVDFESTMPEIFIDPNSPTFLQTRDGVEEPKPIEYKLLPCAHCGSNLAIVKSNNGLTVRCYTPKCVFNPQVNTFFESDAEAIAAANKRVAYKYR